MWVKDSIFYDPLVLLQFYIVSVFEATILYLQYPWILYYMILNHKATIIFNEYQIDSVVKGMI